MKTFLLFAMIALSINAFAQSKHPTFDPQLRTSNPRENVQGMMKDAGSKTTNIYSEINLEQDIKHQTITQRSLIQIYDSIYYWDWDMDNIGWKIDSKTVDMVYDANNNLTSEIYQIWNNSVWINWYRLTYTYDANNNQTISYSQNWNGSAWENSHQVTYTYDTNNNQTSYLSQNWNGSGWENYSQFTYTFDANNNLTSSLVQNWNGNAWENITQSTLTYDANNNQTGSLSQHWNGSAWENSAQYTYTYDANNKMIHLLIQNWNSSAWVNDEQLTFTYDANNNQTSYLWQIWNGSAWENFEQCTYTYDANNNLISKFYQDWKSNAWVNYSQYLYTYDANNFKAGYSNKHYSINGTEITSGDSTYYYFHTVLGINDLTVPLDNIKVSPNPASTTITIALPSITPVDNATLSVYNVNAQQVISRRITEQQTVVDVSWLTQGVYFVRVSNDRTVMVGKFVKQ